MLRNQDKQCRPIKLKPKFDIHLLPDTAPSCISQVTERGRVQKKSSKNFDANNSSRKTYDNLTSSNSDCSLESQYLLLSQEDCLEQSSAVELIASNSSQLDNSLDNVKNECFWTRADISKLKKVPKKFYQRLNGVDLKKLRTRCKHDVNETECVHISSSQQTVGSVREPRDPRALASVSEPSDVTLSSIPYVTKKLANRREQILKCNYTKIKKPEQHKNDGSSADVRNVQAPARIKNKTFLNPDKYDKLSHSPFEKRSKESQQSNEFHTASSHITKRERQAKEINTNGLLTGNKNRTQKSQIKRKPMVEKRLACHEYKTNASNKRK